MLNISISSKSFLAIEKFPLVFKSLYRRTIKFLRFGIIFSLELGDFFSVDSDMMWRGDAELDLLAAHFLDDDIDNVCALCVGVVNDDGLSGPACEN